MGQVFTTPVSDEQKRLAELKRSVAADAVRKTEQDLIIAELLKKISKLEADKK